MLITPWIGVYLNSSSSFVSHFKEVTTQSFPSCRRKISRKHISQKASGRSPPPAARAAAAARSAAAGRRDAIMVWNLGTVGPLLQGFTGRAWWNVPVSCLGSVTSELTSPKPQTPERGLSMQAHLYVHA